MGRLPRQTNPLDSSARQSMTARSSDSIRRVPSIRPIESHEWRMYRDLRLRSLTDSPDAFGTTLAQPVEPGFANAETTSLSRLGRVPVAPRVPAAVW
jgi:hypothetical protein